MKHLLPLILFFSLALNAEGAVTTLYPTDDTKLNPDATTTNYANDTTASSANNDTALIFKFDLTGYTSAEVVSAEFRLYGQSRGYQHMEGKYLIKEATLYGLN